MKKLVQFDRPLNFTIPLSSDSRHPIALSKSEKDLGVLIASGLKWDTQVRKCINAANAVLGVLKMTLKTWTTSTFKQLFSTFARPHLKYASPAWNPYLKKDIKALEKSNDVPANWCVVSAV